MKQKNSIFFKISVALIINIFIVTLLFSFLSTRKTKFLLMKNIEIKGKNYFTIYKNTLKNLIAGMEYDTLIKILENLKEDKDILFGAVINKNNRIIAHTDKKLISSINNSQNIFKEDYSSENKTICKSKFSKDNDYIDFTSPIFFKGKFWGIINLRFTLEFVNSQIKKTYLTNIAIAISTILLALISSFLIAKKIADPIKKCSEGAVRIGNGELLYKIKVKSHDETSELAKQFNNMAEKLFQKSRELEHKNIELQDLNINLEKKVNIRTSELEKAHKIIVEQKKQFLEQSIAGGIAHEIRNSLSSVRLRLDKIFKEKIFFNNINDLKKIVEICKIELKNGNSFKTIVIATKKIYENQIKLNDYFDSILSSVLRSLQITKNVLTYSKFKKNDIKNVISLSNLCTKILDSFKIQHPDIQFSFNSPKNIFFQCDENQFHSIIENLVINSKDSLINCSKKEKKIELFLEETFELISLTIKDNGEGIPEGKLEKIFDPFFSTKPKTGTGLGLSLVKKIVESYDGEISCESLINIGTTFIICFPKKHK